eukprot:gene22028-10003_t
MALLACSRCAQAPRGAPRVQCGGVAGRMGMMGEGGSAAG